MTGCPLVPVEPAVDVTAAGIRVLAEQQQTPEPGVPGVVEEEAEGPLTTKEKITETALDLFSQRGYDGVSVRDIARAATPSPGTGGV